MKRELLEALNSARADRRAAVVVTDVTTGAQRLVDDIAADPLRDVVAGAIRTGRSCMAQTDAGEVFLNVHVPSTRLVILGAVHVAQALAPMAILTGHAVTVVDPREAFATPDRFPNVALVADWPDRALPPLRLDRYTAFVALTHDPKIDDPGLIEALSRDCFYVGALGSKKTHAARRERLGAAGVAQDALDRIHAPVGLPIGAASPAEIAVAILAEITQALRRPEAS